MLLENVNALENLLINTPPMGTFSVEMNNTESLIKKLSKRALKSVMFSDGKPFDTSQLLSFTTTTCIAPKDYVTTINRLLKKAGKEPNFKSESTWFSHVSDFVVKHKTEETTYMRIVRKENSKVKSEIYYKGEQIELSDLFPLFQNSKLPSYKKENFKNTKQAKAGLEIEVDFKVFKLTNIIKLKMNRNVYTF